MAALNVFLGGAESKWRDTSKDSTHFLREPIQCQVNQGAWTRKLSPFFLLSVTVKVGESHLVQFMPAPLTV